MSVTADRISNDCYEQAESPRWTAPGELAWVDLITATLHVGRFSAGFLTRHSTFTVGNRIGSATRIAGSNDWLIGADRGFYRVTPGEVPVQIAALPPGAGWMNDGVADQTGRFWSGTQAYPRNPVAALYSLERDGAVVRRLRDVTVSNGICVTPDAKTLYYIDTLPHRSVEAFDIAEDGSLAGRRLVARIEGGNPDGMTIDEEGCLWVAVWNAGEVVRLDSRGRTVARVQVPARRPTAVTLVDDVLIITTARVGITDPQDGGGHLYAVSAPARGKISPRWGG